MALLSGISLGVVIQLILFTPGRRMLVFRQLLDIAKDFNWNALDDDIPIYIEHDKNLLVTMAEFRRQRAENQGDPVLASLDSRSDRLLGAIYRDCRDLSISLHQDSPEQLMAKEMLTGLFPSGVGVFTKLSYEDQHAEMVRIVGELNQTYAEHVQALGLDIKVKVFGELTAEFGKRLQIMKGGKIGHDQIRASNAQGQEHLLQIVARITGHFYGSSEEHVKARTALLAPILDQQEAIRAHYRARRAVPDVDPTTGEEQNNPDEETSGSNEGVPDQTGDTPPSE